MESHGPRRRVPRPARGTGLELLAADADWQRRAPLPTRRWFHAGAQNGAFVHLVGGAPLGLEHVGVVHEAYDLARDRWERRAPLPAARWMSALAPLGDGVLLAGGYRMHEHAAPAAETWLYEPAHDRWRALAPLPVPIGFPLATTLQGRVVVHDGGDNEAASRGHRWYAYDPARDAWTRIPSSPGTFARGAAVSTRDRLIALGGISEAGVIEPTVNALERGAVGWNVLAPQPQGLVLRAAAALGDRVVAVGGYDAAGGAVATVDVLDLRTGRWSPHPSLPTARASATLAVHGDRLLVVGGWNGAGPLSETLAFRLSRGCIAERRAI